jgi:hypothetical protein
VHVRFFLFTLDNLDGVIAGAAPHFTQLGPYVYREYKAKYDVEFTIDYTAVAFHEHTRFEFDPVQTAAECAACGHPDTDTATNLYLPMYTALESSALGSEANLLAAGAATAVATVALPLVAASLANVANVSQSALPAQLASALDADPIVQWGGLTYLHQLHVAANGFAGTPQETAGWKPVLVAAGQAPATIDELELPRWAVENAPAATQALCHLDFVTGVPLGNTSAGVKRSTCLWTSGAMAHAAYDLLTSAGVPSVHFPACAAANTPMIIVSLFFGLVLKKKKKKNTDERSRFVTVMC